MMTRNAVLAGVAAGLVAGVAATTVAIGAAPAPSSYAEDRAAIENLMFRYVFAMDFRDPQAYANTFAPDGVLNYAGGEMKGREAIAKMIQGLKDNDTKRGANNTKLPAPQPRTHHNVGNVTLDIQGNRATGKAYWVSVSNDGPVPAGASARMPASARVTGYGHYEDELIKTNGQWRFTRRKIFNELLNDRGAVYPLVQPGGP